MLVVTFDLVIILRCAKFMKIFGLDLHAQFFTHTPNNRHLRRLFGVHYPTNGNIDETRVTDDSRSTLLNQDLPIGGIEHYVRRMMPPALVICLVERHAFARRLAVLVGDFY